MIVQRSIKWWRVNYAVGTNWSYLGIWPIFFVCDNVFSKYLMWNNGFTYIKEILPKFRYVKWLMK